MMRVAVTITTLLLFIGCGGNRPKENDLEKAEAFFQKALDYNLSDNDSLALIYYDSAIMYYQDAAYFTNRGSTKLGLNDTIGALEDSFHALQLNPDDETALSNIGLVYMEREDYVTALEYFEKSARIEPSQGYINLSIGYCRYKLEDYQGALDMLMKHLGGRYPFNYDYALELITDCFEKLGDRDDIDWWQEQLELFKSADSSGMLNRPV